MTFNNNDDAINFINQQEPTFLTKAKKRGYVCPICGNGNGSEGTGIEKIPNSEGHKKYKCFNCGSYLDYEYQEGDVVYCDPPYEFTEKYDEPFNHEEFYNWAASRDYQLWFSSYKISNNRFKLVWAKRHTTSLVTGNNTKNFECLYTNK